MNKTISINLAGTFFHIDEDAYQKLQRYLDAVKRSFTDTQGRDEIISDIEARISELFYERVNNERQVVSENLVDEIIAIMGQPEDYIVDEELFEDEDEHFKTSSSQKKTASNSSKSSTSSQKSTTSQKPKANTKKLFRDRDNSYVAGVCSGLGHYLGLDSIWIRLIWVFLALGSAGTFIFIYILFWVLVPEAVSTSDKIQMKGDPVNISNIEKKIKDSIDTVTETVKKVDIQKRTDEFIKGVDEVTNNITKSVENIGSKTSSKTVKKGAKNIGDAIGNIIAFVFRVFGKFLGGILLFVAAATLISLVIGLFSFGNTDIHLIPNVNMDNVSMYTSAPTWLIKLLTLGAVGIPFFFLFYLGLKLIASNSKSINGGSKLMLFFLWIASIIGLGSFGLKDSIKASERTSFIEKVALPNLTSKDTIYISMNENQYYDDEFKRRFSYKRFVNNNDEPIYVSRGVRLVVKSTKENVAKIKIEKIAHGVNYDVAKARAKSITYNYQVTGNTINLDSYFTNTNKKGSNREEVRITVYLPIGSTFYGYDNTYSFHSNESDYNDIFDNGDEEKYLIVKRKKLVRSYIKSKNKEDSKVVVNEDGIDIKTETTELKIDEKGVKGKTESIRVNIDEDGVHITPNEDKGTEN